MREHHLHYLSDPLTYAPLKLTVFIRESEHVMAGLLIGSTSWYPIIHGIPRLLIRELKTNLLQEHQEFFNQYRDQLPEYVRAEWQAAINAIPDLDAFWKHQKKTAESFAYEWKYIYRENPYEKHNFFHFLSPFLKDRDLKGKKTVDIGCGSGRFTKWAAFSKTEVSFGTDLGESVEVAFGLTKNLKNACVVQADIYAMPFANVFDIAYSIGVLHHLPQPEQGFSKLPPVLKPGGHMLIWVYNRRHNWRALYFYEPMRSVLKRLPKPLLFKLCYVPAFVVHCINHLTRFFQKIGLVKIAQRIPFSYYANFPFNMKLNDAFDVLATPKSNYYYIEDIRGWFERASLKNINAYEHKEAGITCIGTRR